MTDTQGCAVYRMYNVENALLYIGISVSPLTRFRQHSYTQPWWTEISYVTLEHFDSIQKADEAETKAIQTENPKYNVAKRHLSQASKDPVDVSDLLALIHEWSYSSTQAIEPVSYGLAARIMGLRIQAFKAIRCFDIPKYHEGIIPPDNTGYWGSFDFAEVVALTDWLDQTFGMETPWRKRRASQQLIRFHQRRLSQAI